MLYFRLSLCHLRVERFEISEISFFEWYFSFETKWLFRTRSRCQSLSLWRQTRAFLSLASDAAAPRHLSIDCSNRIKRLYTPLFDELRSSTYDDSSIRFQQKSFVFCVLFQILHCQSLPTFQVNLQMLQQSFSLAYFFSSDVFITIELNLMRQLKQDEVVLKQECRT